MSRSGRAYRGFENSRNKNRAKKRAWVDAAPSPEYRGIPIKGQPEQYRRPERRKAA